MTSFLLATLAFDHRRIEEGRGETSQTAMGADGTAEAGKRKAERIGRAPAHADGGAVTAPYS